MLLCPQQLLIPVLGALSLLLLPSASNPQQLAPTRLYLHTPIMEEPKQLLLPTTFTRSPAPAMRGLLCHRSSLCFAPSHTRWLPVPHPWYPQLHPQCLAPITVVLLTLSLPTRDLCGTCLPQPLLGSRHRKASLAGAAGPQQGKETDAAAGFPCPHSLALAQSHQLGDWESVRR